MPPTLFFGNLLLLPIDKSMNTNPPLCRGNLKLCMHGESSIVCRWVFVFAILLTLSQRALCADNSPIHDVLADYDAELRQPDGRVDVAAMVARLQGLGVTSYYWLIWHAPTDWDDLKLFLPKAAEAGIAVTVYLVPPTECPPHEPMYSEPFRCDYQRWAEEIARLSLVHSNLTSWVLDDFYANCALFTPTYVRAMQTKARQINPRLAFLPLLYFWEITPQFVDSYRPIIDGAVVAYPQDRAEIDRAWALFNDAPITGQGELSFPPDTLSHAGDFVMARQNATVLPTDRAEIRFRDRDDFTGVTDGYHFKQLLVDGAVVWEADVSGGPPVAQEVAVDVTQQTRAKRAVTIAFRLFDKKGVSNFCVHWHVCDLRMTGLKLGDDLSRPSTWQVNRQGAFATSFGKPEDPAQRRFHVPFIVMTAGDAHEFQMRHGAPASPERIAAWLRMALQANRDGRCDGVVTYCLDKQPKSESFPPAAKLFHEFKSRGNHPE